MKVFIQSVSGDFNMIVEDAESVEEIARAALHTGGYFHIGKEGRLTFVPLHQVEFIREADEDES